jgi:DtxR family Mn-dependent transcriptional regulator
LSQQKRIAESVEMYLKAIAELADTREQVPVTSLAERLGISTVSASEMVHRLQEQRWLDHIPYKGVRLTAQGYQRAQRIIRRQRLWERFLVDELGIAWEQANRFACRLEHGTEPEVTEALAVYLGNPDTCPHGNPIPSAEGDVADVQGVPLGELNPGEGGIIVRIHPEGEHETFCSYLAEHGIVPGEQVFVQAVEPFEGPLSLQIGGQMQTLGRKAAAYIVVERTPED